MTHCTSSACCCHMMQCSHFAPCCRSYPVTCIGYPDPLDPHSPARLILILSPAGFALSHSLALSAPLPPQFPQHHTGQGIGTRLTQGGLARVFFSAPAAAYIDKIRLSLPSQTIWCLIRMSKARWSRLIFGFFTPFCHITWRSAPSSVSER